MEDARQKQDDPQSRSHYDLNRIVPPYGPSGPDPIMGGVPTRNFPDCAAAGNDDKFCCSGTLVARNVVVTARHCGKLTRVFLRGYDVRKLNTGDVIRVARQIDHPDVDVDLSLLILEQKSMVPPRPIAEINSVDTAQAWAVGFGYTDYNKIDYGEKNMVEVPILSLDCSGPSDQAQYGCQKGIHMVAGHRGLDKDTCYGDSGGPLYVSGFAGGYYLLGVTLSGVKGPGKPCGDGGIFLRIDRFVDWIREQTGMTLTQDS